MVVRFCALIPGQGSTHLLGQGDDGARDSFTDRFCLMTGKGGAVLDSSEFAAGCHASNDHRESRVLGAWQSGQASRHRPSPGLPAFRATSFQEHFRSHDLSCTYPLKCFILHQLRRFGYAATNDAIAHGWLYTQSAAARRSIPAQPARLSSAKRSPSCECRSMAFGQLLASLGELLQRSHVDLR
jgi:hypothetical protein